MKYLKLDLLFLAIIIMAWVSWLLYSFIIVNIFYFLWCFKFISWANSLGIYESKDRKQFSDKNPIETFKRIWKNLYNQHINN